MTEGAERERDQEQERSSAFACLADQGYLGGGVFAGWRRDHCGGMEGSIKFLNLSDDAVAQTIVAHTGNVYSVSASKNGLLLASGGADERLNLWRVSDGMLLRSIHAHATAVHGVALSPDASLVISGTGFDKQLKIWRTAFRRTGSTSPARVWKSGGWTARQCACGACRTRELT